ncbi:MAG TPA: SDR family oxidoreductase [Lentimicrobium sp.]|nr:SDR family oxidoreductase [Lentimicrobium sp.]
MKGKVVIITGGSSGIGFALASEFGKAGALVVIAARDEVKLHKAAEELKSKAVKVHAVKADVSQEADCRKLINESLSTFGKIDILINNAGISMRSNFLNTDLSVLHKLMDINFWGTVYCSKYALPYILETKGSIVGIISVAGHIGLPGRTGYSASKFAVRGFLDTVRTENLNNGLHVLVAAPGFTASNIRNTALTADGSMQGESPRDESKMMPADVAARKIMKAITRRKNSIVLTFIEGKFTVWLNKFFPTIVSRLAYNHMKKEPDSPLS